MERITSTYVENTNIDCIKNIINRDHLHIRGEYPSRRRFQRSKRGSPPHTWRIHNHNFSSWIFNRITSTYVENTDIIVMVERGKRDHLHIRGEYIAASFLVTIIKGSPPHTWRILNPRPGKTAIIRITSTYVENTVNTASIKQGTQDHLHIRGEYSKQIPL